MQTRTLFEKCLGQSFSIDGLEAVEGLPYPLIKLDVGHIIGKPPYMETLWVEPQHLQIEKEAVYIECPLWNARDKRFEARHYRAWTRQCLRCGRDVAVSDTLKQQADATGAQFICEQCALLQSE